MQEPPAPQKKQNNSSAESTGEPGAHGMLRVSLSRNKLLSGSADLQYARGRGRMNLGRAGDPQLITNWGPPACGRIRTRQQTAQTDLLARVTQVSRTAPAALSGTFCLAGLHCALLKMSPVLSLKFKSDFKTACPFVFVNHPEGRALSFPYEAESTLFLPQWAHLSSFVYQQRLLERGL